VLVSSESEGYLLAVATGSLVAKTRYERVVNTRPLLTGRVAIFGTSTGEIVSHVVNQSVKAWGFQTGGSIEADPVILADGDIGVVSQAGDVLFLNQTGQVIGRNRILSPVAMDPVTDGQSLYIAGLDQSIWAFASNGALRWRHRTSSPLSDQVAVRSGVVYCTVPGEGLLALSADDGKVLWKAQGTSGSVIASRDGRLLVRTASGIDMLNPANGSVVNKVALPGISLLVPESMDDGVIYAVSTRGTVAKFLPR
jgi:outer membrane protein assembly factor BamB